MKKIIMGEAARGADGRRACVCAAGAGVWGVRCKALEKCGGNKPPAGCVSPMRLFRTGVGEVPLFPVDMTLS